MTETNKIIDLHVHSNKSDGMWSVPKILDKALENNVGVLSFAEHYNLSSFDLAKRIIRKKIEIIPSIELGTNMIPLGYSKKSQCHILVYYPVEDKMYEILNEYEMARDIYIRKMIVQLNEQLIPITFEEIKAQAGKKKSIGRYDLAKALVNLGISKNIEESYYNYLNYNKENNIIREKPLPTELINKINVGKVGIPILAHPNSLRIVNNIDDKTEDYKFNMFIESLVSAGLKGLEAHNSFATESKAKYYENIAKKFGIIYTVGSDFHARKNDVIEIGKGINNNLCITDYKIVQNIKSLHESMRQ